ncbi:MAG: hypothetical protein U1A05_01275, partial [Alphaproteobacteria bacterium]|nr:hypothetical protein [Alphaproteobacteria bacterium]
LGGKYCTTHASGSVRIRQESRGSLVLEDFTLTGGCYLGHIEEIASESVNTENRRIENFILSKMSEKLQLNVLEDSDTESLYGGRAVYEEEEVHVYFRRKRDSILGEVLEILVESPFLIHPVVPVQRFNLVKEGIPLYELMEHLGLLSSK